MKVLITGASGFIGSHVLRELFNQVLDVKAALRNPDSKLPVSVPTEIVGAIDRKTNWDKTLENTDTVIHLAAHAHSNNPNEEKTFYEVNFEGTKNLVERSKVHGIKKFIFLSSVGAVRRISEEPVHEEMKPEPKTPYTKSKYLAEEAIKSELSNTDTKFTIVRAPAVFGLGCRGNLKSLYTLIDKNIPIPLSKEPTIRSIIAADVLSNLISTCIYNESTNNQIFHAADEDQIPIHELVSIIGSELRLTPKTIKIPDFAWRAAEITTGIFDSIGLHLPVTQSQLAVLHEPLKVSSEKLKRVLGWRQQVSLRDSVAQWVRKEKLPRL